MWDFLFKNAHCVGIGEMVLALNGIKILHTSFKFIYQLGDSLVDILSFETEILDTFDDWIHYLNFISIAIVQSIPDIMNVNFAFHKL